MRAVVERLRKELVGEFRPGEWLPSQEALAERLGVGRLAVRKALDCLAAEGWLDRPAHGYGYIVIRPRRTGPRITGLMFPFIADYLMQWKFYREIAIGFATEGARQGRPVATFLGSGLGLLKMAGSELLVPNVRLIDSVGALEIFDTSLLEQLGRLGPLVCLDHRPSLPEVSSAVFDHRISVRMAFKHLLDLGHRRIGYVGRERSVDPGIAERLKAYREAFGWSGLPADPRWEIMIRPPGLAGDQVDAGVHRIARMPPADRPTALIAIDCFWRTTVCLMSHGLDVPGQVSVATIGDVATWAEHPRLLDVDVVPDSMAARLGMDFSGPFNNRPESLAAICPTVVRLPTRKMGEWGMQELCRRLADPAAPPQHATFEADLVAGGTTAAPPHPA